MTPEQKEKDYLPDYEYRAENLQRTGIILRFFSEMTREEQIEMAEFLKENFGE